MQAPKFKFRKDIQVLRALAVVIVVLFHLNITGFSNGFLGVDIFFVVSGFLMHKLYRVEDGPVGFYMRRAKRLLPVYYLIVVITLIAALIVTIPPDFNQATEQGAWAAFFASNIGFWTQDSYFSKAAFNPLLHLWSLGVEIQFYLIFPLILWACRFHRFILPALILLSLLLCFAITSISPKTSFFMVPPRFWEFGLGMLVAREMKKNMSGSPLALLGLGLIALTMFLPFDSRSLNVVDGHPGVSALIACLGTAWLLYFGIPDNWIKSTVGKAAVYLGDISYSVYLIHFPLIVLYFYEPFGGTILGDGKLSSTLLLLAVILALSAISYHYYERRQVWRVRPRNIAIATMIVLLLVVALPSLSKQKWSPYTQNVFAGTTDRAPYRCGKLFRITNLGDDFCQYAPEQKPHGTVMLIGDSHADAIKQSFIKVANSHRLTVAFAVRNDPLVSPALDAKWLVGRAQALGISAVFLHYKPHEPQIVEAARTALWAEGIPVFYIMPVPTWANGVPRVMFFESQKIGDEPAVQSLDDYTKGLGEITPYIATPKAGLTIIPVASALCDPVCHRADKEGHLYYFDEDHLTLSGAALLEPIFGKSLAKLGAENSVSNFVHDSDSQSR